MENSSNRIVAMRLYANWETDRATANAVQRIFTMALSRLTLASFPENSCSLVVTVKLLVILASFLFHNLILIQGCKRNLRSNDFTVLASDGVVDVNLNISFTIQYRHFLKRKANILQVLLQRRKRYKNRHIPGYKTLAVGSINLAEVLQSGSLREISLFSTFCEKDDSQTINACKGKLYFTSCQSQAFEAENELNVQRIKEKELESEEDDYSSTDGQLSDNEHEISEITRSDTKQRLKIRETRQQKIAQRKNIKQKLVSLLKKFKIPEDGAGVASQSGVTAPTAQELEEFIEELDNLSDSGPEMLMDNLSIISNPRPGLQPYFTTSREILPTIADDHDPSEDSEEEWSSDAENNKEEIISSSNKRCNVAGINSFAMTGSVSTLSPKSSDVFAKARPSLSDTRVFRIETKSAKPSSVSKWISAYLRDDPWNLSERIWICSFNEMPILSLLDSTLHILDCAYFNDCRLLISSIVAKIQKFCNTSSTSPPCTVIGIVGYEKLINNVLRAYVETLQNKSTDWMNFLRFCVIAPPWSTVGKLLSSLDSRQNLLKQIFDRPVTDVSSNELKAIATKFQSLAEGATHEMPIGEAMLQLHGKQSTNDEKDTHQLFIPFLSEIRIGQFDDDVDLLISSPRSVDDSLQGNAASGHSPPGSPHYLQKSDSQDLQIEYWVIQMAETSLSQSSTNATMQIKRDLEAVKYSVRSTFRSLTISCKPNTPLLCLQFIKEKRKDKMLQKLGMKKGQRNDSEMQNTSQLITNVTRAICSGKHPLKVWVDGCPWNEVRFFQASGQWQTHVKYFPICLLASDITN
ncbi:unnamed protein product [Dracunculus medinensis]|uniref:Phosphofurin acidic cluster sorting protein 2 n=1 Tax=Dracunculus medinensis TaxID=318479 RepID=A0A0N4U123_DRAME|nr:unnamed protein product [Dracunculus medinensis]